jgi:DNA polymerase-3 subunit delta
VAVKSIEDLKPVYLIFGKEELLLERALRRLRDRIAEVADLDFNFESFDGETADPNVVVAAANTLPFASDRRLVVVRNVDRMRAPQQAVLAEYAADPAPTACLVLVAGTIPKSSRLYKAVDALGGVAEYRAPRKHELPGWVIELFGTRGRQLSRDGAEALVRAVGRDLRRLETEADKIVAFAGGQTAITRADVESVVASTAPVSVFDMLNAIGARECATTLERLDDLLADGEQLLGIHAMTVRHVRTLISVRALLDRGMGQTAIQRELGMQAWQVSGLIEQARRFGTRELSRALAGAAELEARLKSGSGEPRVLWEMWVVGLCKPDSR